MADNSACSPGAAGASGAARGATDPNDGAGTPDPMAGAGTPEIGEHTAREAQLAADGWEKKFTASEPRLSEAKEMYESMGYEVRFEAANTDPSAGCTSCLSVAPDRNKTIWIRKKTGAGEEDLF